MENQWNINEKSLEHHSVRDGIVTMIHSIILSKIDVL